jgi:hypothetical protein
MRWIWTALPAVSLLCVGVRAQVVCTVAVTQPLVVTANTVTQSQPVGPLPQSDLTLRTASGTASSQIQLYYYLGGPILPPGVTGWGFDCQISVAASYPFGGGGASQSGRVLLTFSSPQPVDGVICLRPTFAQQFQVFSGDLTIDTDMDGVPDYFASLQHEQEVDFPLTLDANGRSMAIDFSLNGFTTANSGADGAAHWDVVFLPGTYALEKCATGCVPLTFWRNPSTFFSVGIVCDVTSTAQVPIAAGLFLLGLGPQNVPLPFPPFCPVLVANPAIVPPDGIDMGSLGLFPPDVSLPHGLQFYCQAVWLDAQGNVQTSDCIRTM